MNRRKRAVQLELPAKGRGGRRPKAGRKRIHAKEIAHRRRPSISPNLPLHVTVRMTDRVYNLRSRRSFRVIERALFANANRADARIVRFSVQGNHIHMLVEADDKRALSSSMRSLNIRIGRGLNRIMSSSGQVIAHRYHARPLRTPSEVRNAVGYVRHNYRHHAEQRDGLVPDSYVDPYSSDAPLTFRVPKPTTWLLAEGWRRGAGP
jgi:REP element-mobilizing transposase RayT